VNLHLLLSFERKEGTMPPTPSDEIIQNKLDFLRIIDIEALQAAVILEDNLGASSPAGPSALVKKHVFRVEGTRFEGYMTKAQKTKLQGINTKVAFRDALSKIILKIFDKLTDALQDIDDCVGTTRTAVPIRPISPLMGLAGGTVPQGCCTYDGGHTKTTSKVYCDGIGGGWDGTKTCPPTWGKKGKKRKGD
jgi:hypothetical protein